MQRQTITLFMIFMLYSSHAYAEHWTDKLEPHGFWKEFSTISQIYRPSKKEADVAMYVVNSAKEAGFKHSTDSVGNVLIKMPATSGLQNLPGIILQGHLDMVCIAKPGSAFIWGQDKIKPYIHEEWLKATETTLGADNGIGVAAMIDIMKNPPEKHGLVELLFTVDEEGDFSGVCGLKPGQLAGKMLLNLDSEESGEFNIGCAGGQADILEFTFNPVAVQKDNEVLKIAITGGKSGHSGVDIHRGRANAIAELCKILKCLVNKHEISLIECNGGTTDTAIPCEARAVFSCKKSDSAAIKTIVGKYERILKNRFKEADSDLQVSVKQSETSNGCVPDDISKTIINCFNEVPAGIIAMSRQWPGNVQTSMNPGILVTENNVIRLVTHLQGSTLPVIAMLSRRVSRISQKYQAKHTSGTPYRPWEPDSNSLLLKAAIEIHRDVTSREPYLKVVHAGVECGELKNTYPGIQMLSFGPDVRHAHSPDEMVKIATVKEFLDILRAMIARLPLAPG